MTDLRRQKAAAEAANAAKSRYLASVSHELRSPLNAIFGYAQLLERGGDIDVTQAARIIRRSAEHLTSLIEGLSDISEVESGILRIGKDVVRFGPFLDQIADMFRHGAASKGLRFTYRRPDNLPQFVRVDQNRLRQVLINLLSNAIKFTSSGSVDLRVTYAGQMAIFEISDTGPGIAVEDQGRIFGPFERGSAAPGAEQPGSGLGLAITQALVRILGGDLHLDSEPGKGSVFRVTMMIGHVAGRIGEAAPSASIKGYEGPRRAILLVDDDPDHLSLVRTLLEELGFDVVTATSGNAALELAGRSSLDLALLDITMPGLSGWETAKCLRAALGADLRIIMVSGNVHEHRSVSTDSPAHDQFLVKPVELGALIDAVGSQLALRWLFEDRAEPDRSTAIAGSPTERLSAAAWPHLDRLKELLRIGHVRGVEQEIKALAAAAPEADGLVARLFDGLDRYDFAAMNAALEQHR
jgi:CheY-like chemotaxis protein/anti-sigma regulatory factor (Ser/Thr protein kinase)